MRAPSKERGCDGKMKIANEHEARYKANARSIKYKKNYGVYKCPYCKYCHLTTKLENEDVYCKLLYKTSDSIA